MNNRTTYKSIKIHLWVILFLWVIYVWMIFAYIHQWGNNPVDKAGLIILTIIWIACSVLVLSMRFILTIDDKYVVITFGSLSGGEIKIHISQIEDVSVGIMSFRTYLKAGMEFYKGTKYQFDFTRQAVKIQTKSGKIYQIAIKNAERIKEEIEKRMNKCLCYGNSGHTAKDI